MLGGGKAGEFMGGLWMGMVGVLYSINTDLGNLLLQRKFNTKTPNIYIANIALLTRFDFYGIVPGA